MKIILAAIAFAVLVAAGASVALQGRNSLASDAYKTSGVRLDDPGHNLTGKL